MSTPSTATATLPPHHQYFSHHQSYQPSTNGQLTNGSARLGNSLYNGYGNANSSSDLRRTTTVQSRQPQPQQLPPLNNGHSSDMENAKNRKRNPDWADFYKNGLPKEVIVIDDDEPETSQQRPIKPLRTATNGSTRHTDKKRKTTASTAYDPVYNQQTSYSTTQTPYYDSPSNNTISTDRTTSALNTTAATSLGSQASNGAYIPPLEKGVVGQKRKRVTRRAAQDEANEAKRREIDLHGDPFGLYMPPPNPPIKAKEVFVQVVSDVSAAWRP